MKNILNFLLVAIMVIGLSATTASVIISKPQTPSGLLITEYEGASAFEKARDYAFQQSQSGWITKQFSCTYEGRMGYKNCYLVMEKYK